MKITHITTVHSALDVRIYQKECISLAKNGYDVTLIAPAESSLILDAVSLVSLSLEKSRFRRFLMSTWSAYRKALASGAVIYHFHDPELILIGVLLRLRGKTIIYDVHEDLPRQIMSKDLINDWLKTPLSKFSEAVEWLSSRLFFSAIVTVTPAIAQRFPSSKTVMVQNFPKLAELIPGVKIEWADRLDQVIYLGGIEPVRGAVESIKAFEYLQHDSSRLVLAGQFVNKQLEKECRLQAGWTKVDFKGWLSRNEVKGALEKAKVGLVALHPTPAYLESYPVKLFEYMAAGIPVIASDFPLWREIVDSANCGLLVDPLKPKDIAKAIDWLLDNPKDAEKMGKNGREAVEKIYNWENEEKVLLGLYKNLAV